MSEYESYDYGYDDWGEDGFYDGPKERTYNHVDAFIWLIFPVALLGFISSITSLIFLALFPKPLKTTVIHCIVLCVSSLLTCLISLAQASAWEIMADLKSRGEHEDYIIVDFAIGWITILIIGVANWLFVAFLCVRLYAVSRVNIHSYDNYVTASANDLDRGYERQKPSYVCGVVCVILCFGWLLPTLVLPFFAMLEFYNNWLGQGAQVVDVLGFAFKYDFTHRWGATIYVLLPIGLTVLISAVIVYQTIIKMRGLRLMSSKWDKAKLTLGAIAIFLVTRIPTLVYVFFAFQAFPAAPKKTGDEKHDAEEASKHQVFVLAGNQAIKDNNLGPTGPVCLIFACLSALLNFPLFIITLRRFRSLFKEAGTNVSQCNCCKELVQRSTNDSDISSTDADARENDCAYMTPATTASILATSSHQPRQSSPKDNHSGNFFFNSAHLNGKDFALSPQNDKEKGDFV